MEKCRVEDGMLRVAIVGIGFVGTAMAAAVSIARGESGQPLFSVVAIDQDNDEGLRKVDMVNRGVLPVETTDQKLREAIRDSVKQGILSASTKLESVEDADVVVIDINLDIALDESRSMGDLSLSDSGFLDTIGKIAHLIDPSCLILVETTVPPGYTECKILPVIRERFLERGISSDQVLLAHSYERVMPGPNYLDSIREYFRVFSGINKVSSRKARQFLESIIDTERFPLTELDSTVASETAKIVENAYRALNIAFIQEWSAFAEEADIDLFAVLAAIRVRHTHQNIMNPGFGVGGYCLTKDSYLREWGGRNLISNSIELPLSKKAIEINKTAPRYCFDLMWKNSCDLVSRRVGLFGVSYLPNVADTRFSPSKTFVECCAQAGIDVSVHDSIVDNWQDAKQRICRSLKDLPESLNIVVFAVKHDEYLEFTPAELVTRFPKLKLVVDGNDVVSESKRIEYRGLGVKVVGVGKGHW